MASESRFSPGPKIDSAALLTTLLTNLQAVINDVKTQVVQSQLGTEVSHGSPSQLVREDSAGSWDTVVETTKKGDYYPESDPSPSKLSLELQDDPPTSTGHITVNIPSTPIGCEQDSSSSMSQSTTTSSSQDSIAPPWASKLLEYLETLSSAMSSTSKTPADGWPKLWPRLRTMDDAKVKDYKEDIDTLLVFAGLFSAIVTAFVIAFFVTLQPSSADISAFILFQISAQLATRFPINGTILNSDDLSVPTFPFQIPQRAIRINALWLTSLMFALTTASFGILVKQWLREFLAMEDMGDDERCRLRYIRDWHMRRWRVYDIASFLPLLLQASVILFLVGLWDFAVTLHSTLGWIMTAFLAVYLSLFAFTLLSPIISVHSPFKTPFLKTILQFPRYLFLQAWFSLSSYQRFTAERSQTWWIRRLSALLRTLGIYGDQRYHLRFYALPLYWTHGYFAFERVFRNDRRYDIPLVVFSHGVFLDSTLQSTYQACLEGLSWDRFRKSTLFSPAHTSTTRINTFDGFKTLWEGQYHSGTCQSVLAEHLYGLVKSRLEFPDQESYLDLISYRLLFGKLRKALPYTEVVKEEKLERLARNSPQSAATVLWYLHLIGQKQTDLGDLDMSWASDLTCVRNLLEAYRTNLNQYAQLWGTDPIILLGRAIQQLSFSERTQVQQLFTQCLLEALPKWTSPSRQKDKDRSGFQQCSKVLLSLNLDISDFVPQEVVSFFNEEEVDCTSDDL